MEGRERGAGSGLLYDLGTHLIDQAICLFGKPIKFDGQVFTQRPGSKIDDAFDLKLDYGTFTVNLKSSLLAKEQGPRYVVHASKGSFVKYGLDVQEDHLRSGISPRAVDFGKESKDSNAGLKISIERLNFTVMLRRWLASGWIFLIIWLL